MDLDFRKKVLFMTNLAGKYLGKEMTWEEMEAAFPDLWVFVTNYENAGINIFRGVLIGAFTDEDCDEFYIECLDKGIDVAYNRTTEVHGNFFFGGY